MNTASLIYPTITLIILTFSVAISLVVYRFSLVLGGKLSPGYFRLNRGGEPPARHDALEHNFSNLFEVPTLYYAAVAIAIATNNIDQTLVTLAWTFVAFRIAHTLVHVIYNNIIHRLSVFFTSVVIVGVIWSRLVSAIITSS